MLDIPLNHKTIFVLDHSSHFASSSEQPIEFDAPVKPKATTSAAQQQAAVPTPLKFNPLVKSLWTCNVEAILEYSRIVYDLFAPNEKLIRLMVTKVDMPLNSWNENEQTLEHVEYNFLALYIIELAVNMRLLCF